MYPSGAPVAHAAHASPPTIDIITAGRLIPGFGLGWSPQPAARPPQPGRCAPKPPPGADRPAHVPEPSVPARHPDHRPLTTHAPTQTARLETSHPPPGTPRRPAPVHHSQHGTNNTPEEVPKTHPQPVRKGHSHGHPKETKPGQ
ncbi:hypothetical protein GCM10029964_079610 [Kibdelosporangium lantanae]